MLKSFLKSIKDEWNLMINEKMIFIVILIIPILINLLIGYEFSKGQIDHIKMAINDQDNSSLSRMITSSFIDDEVFDVEYFTDNSDDMKDLFKESKIKTGLIIPKGFKEDVTKLKSPSVLLLYDGSHMPTASKAKSKASEILLTLKTGTSIKMISGKLNLTESEAKNIAQGIKFRQRTLYNPTKSYKNFLNTGLGTAVVQSAIALMAAVAIRRNKLNKKKSKRASHLLGKILFYGSLGFISLILCILIQWKVFNIPFRGDFKIALILSLLLSLSVSTFSIMVSSLISNKMVALLINAVIFVPNTLMVGYTWPVMSMPKPYRIASGFYPFYHYADNLRNLFLKGIDLASMYGDLFWYLKFILVAYIIALIGVFIRKVDTEKEGDKVVS
ncbi:MAG: ABC transporter permease [Firmicutes bacterium]|nr:ABC transporter permease [Bacillota bacterium]